jgi:hypothetical protein
LKILFNKMFIEQVSEINLVKTTNKWWVDTGATRHICSDKKMFSTYQSVGYGEQLFMGNSSTSKVEGKGKVVLKISFKDVQVILRYTCM